MTDFTLLIPHLVIFAAALVALAFRHPALNRRLTITQLSWLLALAPLTAFLIFYWHAPQINAGDAFIWQWSWLPNFGLTLGFYIDGLSLFFALIVTFIGILVVIYTGYYFKGDQKAWRFHVYMLLFMVSMLGVVTAGDVLTLFIFWEGTSILSYLLVAYKYYDEEARRGAFRALLLTGGGGIALIAGLLMVAYVAGASDFATILSSGDALRGSELYLVMLGLVAFGAFTKSAQWPAHIWLPGAMSAPTPASAFLHSATMVKAGIYLMARMNPALGFTDAWFWLLTVIGGITMVAGAYLGLKQNDLKGLLAYSTISQLGVLMMLIGQDIPEAYKALVVGILAHAMYKSALFLVAGIIDHETGTRDMRRLGGLHKVMPYSFAIATLAALSMAGLPPMFGFLAKETLLVTTLQSNIPAIVAPIVRATSVVAGALMLAQAALLVWETFLGKAKDPKVHGHEAPWGMLVAPAVPAVLSLVFSILPGPKEDATLLAGAAAAAFGDKVKVSTVLFHGLTVELMLSLIAISLGFVLFYFRHPIRAWQQALLPSLSFEAAYRGYLALIDKGSYYATRLQHGKLRAYLLIMVASSVFLVTVFSWENRALIRPPAVSWPLLDFSGEILGLRLFSLVLIVVTSSMTILLVRDFDAILALSISGFSMALLFVLEQAPDVALVQVVVDILALVILVLALTRLPRQQRRKAQELTLMARQNRHNLLRDALVAIAIGAVVTVITLSALLDRPRESLLTPFYTAAAQDEVGAADIVSAILVDFRALDTLLEIVVFGVAGMGIYSLLRFAAQKHGDRTDEEKKTVIGTVVNSRLRGIAGLRTSPFIRVPTYVALPISMLLGATHMMYGHEQPGDGFTAGVIISLAVALWFVVFGYEETRRRLRWLRGTMFVGAGVTLAIITGSVSAVMKGSFLAHVEFFKGVVFLPESLHISSSFLFEVAICLTVLGSAARMLISLGHPERGNGA